ncbi:MAG: LPS assembly lipoprotein LptE [Luteibaculaceae bacterium]
MALSRNILFLFLAIFALHACKISYSFTGADVPVDARHFSVKLFNIQATLAPPDLGQVFTEDLKDLILAQTRLDVIPQDGHLQYEGTITAYQVMPTAITSGETAALNRLTISVKVKYKNTFDKDKNFEATFTRFADYDSNLDLSAVERGLIEEINEQITQDIFDRSLGAW